MPKSKARQMAYGVAASILLDALVAGHAEIDPVINRCCDVPELNRQVYVALFDVLAELEKRGGLPPLNERMRRYLLDQDGSHSVDLTDIPKTDQPFIARWGEPGEEPAG
jgi:hypothetical protein